MFELRLSIAWLLRCEVLEPTQMHNFVVPTKSIFTALSPLASLKVVPGNGGGGRRKGSLFKKAPRGANLEQIIYN